jgi:hypothetical protein
MITVRRRPAPGTTAAEPLVERTPVVPPLVWPTPLEQAAVRRPLVPAPLAGETLALLRPVEQTPAVPPLAARMRPVREAARRMLPVWAGAVLTLVPQMPAELTLASSMRAPQMARRPARASFRSREPALLILIKSKFRSEKLCQQELNLPGAWILDSIRCGSRRAGRESFLYGGPYGPVPARWETWCSER